jgi:hypothetical protein
VGDDAFGFDVRREGLLFGEGGHRASSMRMMGSSAGSGVAIDFGMAGVAQRDARVDVVAGADVVGVELVT